jgi:hypothetical protein
LTLARGRVFSLFSFFSFSHTPVFSVSSFFPRPPPKKNLPAQGVEWAHIDIAGPAWSDGEGGATGFGVATLARWASEAGARVSSKSASSE